MPNPQLDPGPFAPMIGYVTAILAAIFLVSILWRGRLAVWNSPEEELPRTAPKIVSVITGVAMVILWLWAAPDVIWGLGFISIFLAILLILSYLTYSYLVGVLSYKIEVPIGQNKTRNHRIVGGFWLESNAKERLENEQITIQELLQGAAYNPDRLWSRTSRSLAKTTLLLLYLAIMFSGTLAISGVGFLVQVGLTGKPAASIIYTKDAPGIKPEQSPKTSQPNISPTPKSVTPASK
jgi:hypothetical protein